MALLGSTVSKSKVTAGSVLFPALPWAFSNAPRNSSPKPTSGSRGETPREILSQLKCWACLDTPCPILAQHYQHFMGIGANQRLALLEAVLTNGLEVLDGILGWPVVQHSPCSQQCQAVKQSEYGVPRLVDGEDDGPSLF